MGAFIKRNKLYLYLIILFGIFIGVLLSPLFSMFMQFFSNIFFFGNSDAKLLGYLVYMMALVSYVVLSRKGYSVKVRIKNAYVWGSIAVVALLNLCSFFTLVLKLGLDIRNYPIFITNGIYENISHLLHIHTLKPALTWPLTLFGVTNLNHYGDGLLFFNYMPVFYIISSLCLLVMMVLIVLKAIEKINSKNTSLLYLAFYAIVTLGIIKTSVDGGPLNNEFILSAVFYYLLLTIEKYKDKETTIVKKPITALLIMTVGYFVYYYFFIGNSSLENLYHIFTPIYSVFFILIALILKLFGEKSLKWPIILLLFMGLLLQYDSPTMKGVIYTFQKIPEDTRVVIYEGKELPYPVMYKGPVMTSYYTYAKKGERIIDYIVKDRLRFLYYPVNVDGVTCFMSPQKLERMRVLVLEGSPNSNRIIGGPTSFSNYSVLTQDQGDNYILEFQPNGCYPALQHLIAQELLLHGVTKGIVLGDVDVPIY